MLELDSHYSDFGEPCSNPSCAWTSAPPVLSLHKTETIQIDLVCRTPVRTNERNVALPLAGLVDTWLSVSTVINRIMFEGNAYFNKIFIYSLKLSHVSTMYLDHS